MSPENPPAFPRALVEDVNTYDGPKPVVVTDGGMTLRDYFAAQAMAGLIASNDDGAGDRITDIPEYAYLIADAMLAERSKR